MSPSWTRTAWGADRYRDSRGGIRGWNNCTGGSCRPTRGGRGILREGKAAKQEQREHGQQAAIARRRRQPYASAGFRFHRPLIPWKSFLAANAATRDTRK